MTVPSPRNPNVCPGCEQLLEDDCAALNEFLGHAPATEPEAPARSKQPGEAWVSETDRSGFLSSNH